MSADNDEKIDVGGLAAVINARLAAEARVAKAIAFGWLCGGAAIAFFLTGLGIASAFYGYSYMLSVKPAADQTAKALVEALGRTELKTVVSGTMSLSPNSELKLASGQTVKIKEGATVKLDPQSSVRVVGDLKVDIPQPTKQQLQVEATSESNELPITDYTIFKSVSFGSGLVVSGWNYDLSNTTRPKFQYCYYGQSIGEGLATNHLIAVDGSPQKPSPLMKLSFNFDGALSNCMWSGL